MFFLPERHSRCILVLAVLCAALALLFLAVFIVQSKRIHKLKDDLEASKLQQIDYDGTSAVVIASRKFFLILFSSLLEFLGFSLEADPVLGETQPFW